MGGFESVVALCKALLRRGLLHLNVGDHACAVDAEGGVVGALVNHHLAQVPLCLLQTNTTQRGKCLGDHCDWSKADKTQIKCCNFGLEVSKK